jgi:hypothetical protein
MPYNDPAMKRVANARRPTTRKGRGEPKERVSTLTPLPYAPECGDPIQRPPYGPQQPREGQSPPRQGSQPQGD